MSHCQSNGKTRTGTITVISNNGDSRKISVKQWGDPTDFRASSSTVKFGTSSDYKYIDISNNSRKNISVSKVGDWLGATVVNSSKIKVSCSQNNSSPRSAYVTITCGNEEIHITIKQDGWAECSSCRGTGQVSCDNLGAQWNVDPFSNSYHHQVSVFYQGYYGALPYYTWKNCPTCGGDGKMDCTKCGGYGKIRKSD